MSAVETQRTVVKSVPELWAELSEVALLQPMLGHFGEIRITRLVPEASIEWESESAAGSVELAPSGFGTRVRLTAQIAVEPGAPMPAETAPVRVGLFARLLRRRGPAAGQPSIEAPASVVDQRDARLAQGALTAVLDEIGTARHRPFSRDAGTPPPTA
jgi:hypothetical protein